MAVTSYKDLRTGVIVEGCIVSIKSSGMVVTFYNNVRVSNSADSVRKPIGICYIVFLCICFVIVIIYSVFKLYLIEFETWPVRKENEVTIQRAEIRMVRWMCDVKVKDRVLRKELRERMNVTV